MSRLFLNNRQCEQDRLYVHAPAPALFRKAPHIRTSPLSTWLRSPASSSCREAAGNNSRGPRRRKSSREIHHSPIAAVAVPRPRVLLDFCTVLARNKAPIQNGELP